MFSLLDIDFSLAGWVHSSDFDIIVVEPCSTSALE